MARTTRLLLFFLFLFALSTAFPAYAQEAPAMLGEANFDLEADEFDYNEENQLLSAFGNVEIMQENGRILKSEMVQYSLKTGRALAIGDVVLVEPTGEVLFAEYMELESGLAEGFLHEVTVVFSENGQLAAKRGFSSPDGTRQLEGARFTACHVSEGEPPFWQIKALTIQHDTAAKDINYKHASLEVLGVPVAYTPYFSHPDPTVKRRNGLLRPEYGSSSELGTFVKVPLYYEFSPSTDITLTPQYYSNDGLITNVRVRSLLDNAAIDWTSSGGKVEKRTNISTKDTFRWHIDSTAQVDIDDKWRANFEVERASDKTYKRRYGFGGEDILTSKAEAEYFDKLEYGLVNTTHFQGLRTTDIQEETAQVLPKLKYTDMRKFDRAPGFLTYDFENVNLAREKGDDYTRITGKIRWDLPLFGANGQLLNIKALVQSDLYAVDDFDSITDTEDQQTEARLTPVFAADWRWPFLRQGQSAQQVIEPIVQLVAAPNSANSNVIPNEDSQAFEFDENNLFSLNRFPGEDRITSGQRVDYALKVANYQNSGLITTFLAGQSYAFKQEDIYNNGTGLENNLSDVVGKLEFILPERVEAFYRFRADVDSGTMDRTEVGTELNLYPIELTGNYINLKNTLGLDNTIGDREEISGEVIAHLSPRWDLKTYGIRDIAADKTRRMGAGLYYENECFNIGIDAKRDFTDDGETEPSDSIGLTFNLRFLGGQGFGN